MSGTGDGPDQASTVDLRTAQIMKTVPAGAAAFAVAIDSGDERVVIINNDPLSTGAGSVTILDARTGVTLRTVTVGEGPVDLAVDPVTHHAFIVNTDSNTVSIIDTAAT